MQTRPPIELREPEQIYRAALLLHHQGRFAEAERLYRVAVEGEPGHVQALYNLGLIRLLDGDVAAAIGLIGQALERRPDFAEGHNALAIALRAQGRIAGAIGHFEQAIAIAPDLAEAHNNYAATLLMANHFDAAAEHYQRALALKPEMAEAQHGYGNLLTIFGRTEAAQRAIETAIDRMPKRAEFYRSLGEIKQFRVGDRQIAMVEALAREADRLPEDDRIHLDFALGKIYADLGQHERAFRHLLDGNARKRKQIDYDERAALERFTLARGLFSAEVMAERAGFGDPSPLPIFIIGMPRSGTTLVEQILAAHPQVHGGGELGDFEAAVAGLAAPDGTPPDVGGAELRQIGARYLERVRPLAPQAVRITDKMPGNFRFAGLIHLALPNARIIHVSRDPVDTCFSCFSILFGGDQPYSYDLSELGRFYRGYAALMAHWRAVLPASVMLEVQYEELVADFEPQARRIVAHGGLDWNDACQDFHKAPRPVRTASSAQVRRPLYRGSVGRWRPYEEMLQPLLAALDGVAV